MERAHLRDSAHVGGARKGRYRRHHSPDRFEGSYSTLAEAVNDMVAGHISVKKKAMACVEEFSKGNFDASLEQFPGKKAFINDAIERLRGNIKRFIEEMNHMSEEHNKGDIDVMIPFDRFEIGRAHV